MSSTIQIARSTNVTDREDQLTVEPLHIHSEMMFNTTGGYGNAILPAVLMLILHQTLLLGVGMAAGTARENNRYEDLVPISRHYNGILRIVLGKSLCYILVYLVIGTYLGLVVPRIFGFTALNHPQVFFPFLFAYVLATTFFAMACSCLVHHRENVMLLVIFTSLPLPVPQRHQLAGKQPPHGMEICGLHLPFHDGRARLPENLEHGRQSGRHRTRISMDVDTDLRLLHLHLHRLPLSDTLRA